MQILKIAERRISIALLLALAGLLVAEASEPTMPETTVPKPTVPKPTVVALQRATGLRATHSGIDAAGNLWWWSRGSRLLQVLSPGGEVLLTEEIDGGVPTALTYDLRWGAATLDGNRDLLVQALHGETSDVRIAREEDATQIAWLDAGRLAVAPARAAYRVEVWDVDEQRLVERWGEEEAIPDGPGFHRVRTVLLAWDAKNERLWTLETFTGELVVLSGRGEELLRKTLAHPRLGETLAWVKDMEARTAVGAREQEDSHLNLWVSLSLASDGSAWILISCDRERGAAQFFRLTPSGEVEAREVDLGCCPGAVRFWGTEMISLRDPRLPGGQTCKGPKLK